MPKGVYTRTEYHRQQISIGKAIEDRECPICKKTFSIPSYSEQIFCSHRCFGISIRGNSIPKERRDRIRKTLQKERETRYCLFCNKEMSIRKTSDRKFCSRKCSISYQWHFGNVENRKKNIGDANRIPKILLICEGCGKEFEANNFEKGKRKFCSPKCSGLYGNRIYPPKVERKCCACGKTLFLQPNQVKERNFCGNACSGIGRRGILSGENNPNWAGGIGNFPYPIQFNKSLKQFIKDRDGHICQLCGKTEEQEKRALCIHHIDYIKENLSHDNLITLCRGCNGRVNKNRELWTNFFKQKQSCNPLGVYNEY